MGIDNGSTDVPNEDLLRIIEVYPSNWSTITSITKVIYNPDTISCSSEVANFLVYDLSNRNRNPEAD